MENNFNGERPVNLFIEDELEESLRILGQDKFLELWEKVRPKLSGVNSKVIVVGTGKTLKKINGMIKKTILGISGHIGSGKDTTAKIIWEIFNDKSNGAVQLRFADALKSSVAAIVDEILVDRDFTHEQKNKIVPAYGKTIGTMLQEVGVHMRKLDEDFWVKSAFAKMDNPFCDTYIISDVRFENECMAIKKAGGIIIRLEGDPGDVRKNSTRDLTHISETALDGRYDLFDMVIDTDKTNPDQIKEQLTKWFEINSILKIEKV